MSDVQIKIGRREEPAPMFPEIATAGYEQGQLRSVGILEAGMTSGKTSLWLNIQGADGRWVCVQASAAMLETINSAVRGAEQRWADNP